MIRVRFICILSIVLLAGIINSSSANYPQSKNNYVNDYAGVLTAADAKTLYNMLYNLEHKTKIEATVVTINSVADYGTGDGSIESFATNLFNTWHIGNMPRNDGVLILVSIKDRRCRIELGKDYNSSYDSRMKRIIDNVMVPYFKQGYYSAGILSGTKAVVGEIASPWAWLRAHTLHIVLVILIITCVVAGFSCMRSGKSGWGWAFFTAAAALFIWLIGIIFSRGSNDCSDSFGGGDSDGGGASGSW